MKLIDLKAAHLNGKKKGTVQGFLPAKGRYIVELKTNGPQATCNIKPANLEHAAMEDEDQV